MSSFIIFQFFFFFALVHIHNQEKYERVIYFAYFAFSFTLLSVLYLPSVFLLFVFVTLNLSVLGGTILILLGSEYVWQRGIGGL